MHALQRVLFILLALALAPSPLSAQIYPTRPITIVLGFTPGAASDTAARLMGHIFRPRSASRL